MTNNEKKVQAYKAAVAADEVFHAELVRQFGKKKAGDARYMMKATYDDATMEAHKKFREASAAYQEFLFS